MNSHSLEIDSIIKSFGTVNLLTDVYLRCNTGDIIGLFGRNGEGKTVLLKIIFGTMNADQKFIRLDETLRLSSPYTHKGTISFLPQDSFLPKDLRVRQVVKLYLPATMESAFLKDDEVVQGAMSMKVKSLSDGIKRYLEIKLLCFNESKFLLLDEPFTYLSPLLKENTKKLIADCSNKKGIIITDHNYEDVWDISTKKVLLKEGVLKVINEMADLRYGGYCR